MDNSKKAFKSGIWYTASNFLVRSIGFLTTPIFTRLLSKDEYGGFNNFVSWQAIAVILVTLHLEATLLSARYDFEEKFDEYIFSMLSLSSVSCLLWYLLTWFFSDYFTSLLNMSRFQINLLMVYLLFLPAVTLFQTRERYYFKYKMTVLTSVILSVGTAVLSVGLVILMQKKLDGRIIGAVLPTVLLGIVFFIFFIKKGKMIRISYWKYAVPICLPYIPHLLSLTLLNSTDRVMITKFCGTEDTAMYSLAYNCGAIVTLLMTSLNSAYAPWLAESLSLKHYNEVNKFSKTYTVSFLFMAIGIMLVAPEVLLILGGEKYIEAKYVMTPVAMGCVCQFLYTLFVNVEQINRKTFGMAIASMIAAVVNLGLNYMFIPQIGYLAAAYTTLVGYVCLLLIHMYLVYRLGFSKLYNYRHILMIVAVGVICMALITVIYSYNPIRYIILAIYMLFFLYVLNKYKRGILSLLKPS